MAAKPKKADALARARQRLGLEIVPGSADPEGLLNLTRLMYPQLGISKPEYLAWQYQHNPAGPAYVRLGKVADKVVGQYSVIPLQVKLGHELLKGSLSVNTMTHPDYRGQGLFMLLAEEVYQACAADGAALTIGFPNQNSHKGFLRHLDFTDAGQLPLWLLPLNPAVIGKTSQYKLLFPLLLGLTPGWRWALNMWQRRGKPSLTLRPITALDESFDQFWEKSKTGYPNLIVRDKTYLDWRFLKHPTRKYSMTGAFSENELKGYIVTRESSIADMPCGLIVDLFVPNTEEGRKTAKELVRSTALELMKKPLAVAGALASPRSPLALALGSSGFFPCPASLLPQPFPVIMRWNSPQPAPARFSDLTQWYLTMGDYDAV